VLKITTIVTMALLAGCASVPTMQELEQQAFISGDWSAVEKRERSLLRRQMRAGEQCPAGKMRVFEAHITMSHCSCVAGDMTRSILAGR